MRTRGVLVIALLALLCLAATQSYAATFTWVKTINLDSVVGNRFSIEVDVVGNELYVANYWSNKYYRIDPVTNNLLGSFSLGNGILIDNHGSEYNPTTGRILHASDRDAGGALTYDAYFQTDIKGVVTDGPYPLFGPEYITNDPEGLTVDPTTGRVWISLESRGGGPEGIFEVNPNNGIVINHLNVGPAWALGFNPTSGKLFFADQDGVIKEVAPDGSGLATVFDSGVSYVFGMAFTPTGDLVLLNFEGAPSQLLLYDSSDDADDVFTTAIPVVIDVKSASINIKKQSLISVSILATEEFDAFNGIQKDSLTFGPTGDEGSLAYCNDRPKDTNRDGFKDLLCYFYSGNTGFQCGDNEGILRGLTTKGIPIEGSDSVIIVPCK